MERDFQRIAIVNRGEAAMRLIHAVRELNREHGTTLRTIALVTEPDRGAMFAREADEVLRPRRRRCATARRAADTRPTSTSSGSSGRCATRRADAAWVGWGFVAEHARVRRAVRAAGCRLHRPESRDDAPRSATRSPPSSSPSGPACRSCRGAAAPCTRRSRRSRQARALGFPLLVKATAGGGGRGIREVHDETELLAAFESASRGSGEGVRRRHALPGAAASPRARHVEVQVIADRHGTAWALGVRDCTIQRRHQKVLEEAPSPALSAAEDAALRAAAVRLAQAASYESAGTVEFLFDEASRTALFMEVNARLQVEHPVTECTTGTDLVKLQLHVARGGRLDGPEPPAVRGHAIEVRLNAEDPERGFAPAPGVVELLRLPGGPGIRIDRGIDEGDGVAPQFDSMIAKIIAHGRDRDEALARLRRALAETTVVVRGGTTNRAFLLGLLDRDEVARGEYDTGWLDRLTAEGAHVPRGRRRGGAAGCRGRGLRGRGGHRAARLPRLGGAGSAHACGPRSATAPSCESAAPRTRSTCAVSARPATG